MTKKQNRALRSDLCWILLFSLLFTFVAYVNYRPISEPTGTLFIGELKEVRQVLGAPGYLALEGFGDDDRLHLDKTPETLTLLNNPDALGKEYTIHAEYKRGNIRSVADDSYYQVTSMVSTDGAFAFTWEDYAAIQANSLWWKLLVAFCLVWLIGGIYLWVQHSDPPQRRKHRSNNKRKRKK